MPTRKTTPVAAAAPKLNKRETDILLLLGQGKNYGEVASALGVSYETVRSHARRLRRRLQLGNKTRLALWAATNL